MFDKLLESAPRRDKTRKPATLAVSVVLHGSVLLTLFLVPLFMEEMLQQTDLLAFVSAPPSEGAFPRPVAATHPKRTDDGKKDDTSAASAPPSDAEPDTVSENVPDKPPLEITEADSNVGIPYDGNSLRADEFGGGAAGPNLRVEDAPLPPLPPPPAPDKPEETAVKRPRPMVSITPAMQKFRVDPPYPELAKKTHVQGPVVLRIVIDATGRVAQVTPVSGHVLLVQAAVEAVKKWVYTPTVLNGTPVEVEGVVVINFSLR